MLHVGNLKVFQANHGRGHFFFLFCNDVKDWRSSDGETSYDLICRDGGKTERAKDLTVDELLRESDMALITTFFLSSKKETEVLGGQITVTVNATKTKHFSIHAQKCGEEGWCTIEAEAD